MHEMEMMVKSYPSERSREMTAVRDQIHYEPLYFSGLLHPHCPNLRTMELGSHLFSTSLSISYSSSLFSLPF